MNCRASITSFSICMFSLDELTLSGGFLSGSKSSSSACFGTGLKPFSFNLSKRTVFTIAMLTQVAVSITFTIHVSLSIMYGMFSIVVWICLQQTFETVLITLWYL